MNKSFLTILFFICCIIIALCISLRTSQGIHTTKKEHYDGGGHHSPHIIIDTLNLTHYLTGKISVDQICKTIDLTAPILTKKYPGRVMYVLKDRESQFNDHESREIYKKTSERNNVYIMMAERYSDPPKGVPLSKEHSAIGRDDFFMGILAHRYHCAVLTSDKLRDFKQFRANIQPFYVIEYAFWRTTPDREFIMPNSASYLNIKKPKIINTSTYF